MIPSQWPRHMKLKQTSISWFLILFTVKYTPWNNPDSHTLILRSCSSIDPVMLLCLLNILSFWSDPCFVYSLPISSGKLMSVCWLPYLLCVYCFGYFLTYMNCLPWVLLIKSKTNTYICPSACMTEDLIDNIDVPGFNKIWKIFTAQGRLVGEQQITVICATLGNLLRPRSVAVMPTPCSCPLTAQPETSTCQSFWLEVFICNLHITAKFYYLHMPSFCGS